MVIILLVEARYVSTAALLSRFHSGYAVPPGCEEGVEDSARLLCANLPGWTDTDALQQPLSCTDRLSWGCPSHGSLIGCLEGERGRVDPQDCFGQVCSNACNAEASA